ncbi:MAG: hypothetical protein ACP6IP_05645 [Candidatus Njordarchaeia archaeon]
MLYPFKLDLLFRAIILLKQGKEENKEKLIKRLGVKKNLEKKFFDTAIWISERIGEFSDFREFKERLIDVLVKEFKVDEVISNLSNAQIPLNIYTVKIELEKLGVKLDKEAVKFLIATLKETNVIAYRQIPIWIRNESDALYEFILDRGAVRFAQIQRRFSNARELLLELAKKKRVQIEGLDELGIEIAEIEDFDRIDPNTINQNSKLIRLYREPSSGKLYAMIVIPKNVTVRALW